MDRTLRNILSGVGSLLDLWPARDRELESLMRELDSIAHDRPGDFEMVMLDMRRVMLRHLDMIPADERTRIREELRANESFGFERRLGLSPNPNGARREDAQLALPFAG